MTPVHPQLEADTHRLGRVGSGTLLLHRNAALPWFILVPDTGVSELHQLDSPLRQTLAADQDALAGYLQDTLGCHKVNVAAIGNLVPQLHVHVVGRRRDDPCWPGVVWGRLPAGPDYPAERLQALRAELAAVLDLRP